jgi:hypothetical protein
LASLFDSALPRRSTSSLDEILRTLCVQFQPNRAASIKVESVVSLISRIASKSHFVRAFAYQKGSDRGPYINFQFNVLAMNLFQTWSSVRAGSFGHRALGPQLRRSCIVTCEGTHGWDNYLLLYHFNSKLKLDTLRNV